jgi:hypothetical protein
MSINTEGWSPRCEAVPWLQLNTSEYIAAVPCYMRVQAMRYKNIITWTRTEGYFIIRVRITQSISRCEPKHQH